MKLRRLVTWSYRRRRRVVVLWIAAIVAASVLAGAAGGETEQDMTVPGSDSAEAVELLRERFPEFAGGTVDVAYTDPAGVTDPATTARVGALADDIAGVDHVVAAEPGPLSPDGTTGLLKVRFDQDSMELPAESIEEVIDRAGAAEGDGLRIELGGYPVEKVEQGEAGSESVGLMAALVILLVAFGSVLAAGLPLVVAGFGLGLGLAGVRLATNLVEVPDFGVMLATMIGIGVGIDYALFIVTRYRSALAEGREPSDAVELAGTTAGRAVVFAGSTVVVSIFGLVLVGRSYLWGVALSTSLVVLAVVLASVTVLPALLGFAGTNIDRLRVPRVRPAAEGRRTLSWRWSRVMQRRPLVAGLGALVVLLVLAAPATDMRFGMPDAGNGSTELTSRRAYDLISEGFGRGANGPLLVAADLSDAGDEAAASAAVEAVAADLAATEGVATIVPPVVNGSGDAAVISVVPATGPQDEATQDLVHTLRDDVIPDSVAGTGVEVAVGGTTAAFIDDSEQTAGRLPLLIGGVVVLSFVLLMSVFRSIPVALKAAVMNILSIGAAYGVMTLAADGGWFGGLVGIDDATPVPAWLPMMMFAILFGLSMDYEVFLLSRIREEHLRTGDDRRAVADGLASTARVITAAAAIMVTVFGAFVMEDVVFLKLAGIGLATAVLVDATVVRMVLVPATMELLGDRNWWLPRWLDRLLPAIDVEGGTSAPPPDPAPPAGAVATDDADPTRVPVG
ncbi:MMPL family transporter [Iamia sp. SCSIO 61187]|uniref:MMPL family transporter n=1 Tax=Iamia sp. SCSIO 61187 TaxID=2722752 RepID=UPI001C63058A|nr:MMPL family transporter [Iamia sp. SCSIO 61187]QYG92489.1 MMPL family transporter [Iamia sp. SCSIO 61187]